MFEDKVNEEELEKTEGTDYAVCFKSKLLNKYFDSKQELIKAESAYREAHKKELKEKEDRLVDVKSVQSAANDYLTTLKDNNAKKKELDNIAAEKYNTFKSRLDSFAKKHQGYHLTYSADKNGAIEFKVEEARRDELEDAIEESRRMFSALNNLFNGFWLR